MPRRRLHGETQKERQKKSSRTLKLRGSVQRKAETRVPLPFESSPDFESQDIEFLEAMRNMQVQRLPGQGGAPARQEAFERVSVATDAGDDALFRSLMQSAGVIPAADANAQPNNAGASGPAAVPAEDPTVPDAPWALPEEPVEDAAPPARLRHLPRIKSPPPPPLGTRFEEGEDGAKLMEEALRSEIVDLNDKFQGAPAGRPPRSPVSRSSTVADPDDELDLHGKTQEEAIRLVQHFLQRAKHKRLRAVLIITGRGLNSGAQGPVLRNTVQSWLERNAGTMVRRFAWAPPRLGGDGAIWVELW